MSVEKHEFEAEVKQLLGLMIHSLYSHKEVFLRELISNASDAIDKLRFDGLTRPELLPSGAFEIRLGVDEAARTLSVEDNGAGMSREEAVANLGTIARSGTGEFIEKLKASSGKLEAPDLIGQFGVGFYASFMAADEVSVLTRKAGESGATLWKSDGGGGYSVEEAERDEAGTTVTLQLKPADSEDGLADFAQTWTLRQTVKKYSDFVAYPIHLDVTKAPTEEEEPADAETAPASDEPLDSNEPLNSMKAIWTRPESEVGEEEYSEFYKHISHDHSEPMLRITSRLEGTFEARSLLYVPGRAPFDLYHREMAHRGIQLYVRRVFIMDECRELMPEYLRFVKGVVDAEDVSLNVSREMLQQDRQIRTIRKHLVKKILDTLKELKKADPEKYLRFWAEFGPVLKEGLLAWDEKRERILDLLLCPSSHHESELTSLDDYVERMPEAQEEIYYLVGPKHEALVDSPHLEAFRDKGIEVLLLSDPVDEVWLQQMPPEFQGKSFKSVGRGEVDLASEDEKQQAEETRKQEEETYQDVIAAIRSAVQDEVKEVRLSSRLTSSPACLVLDDGEITPQLEAMLRQAGQEVPTVKPILELNGSHPLLQKLQRIFDKDAVDPRIASYAQLLFGQALLAEGGQLADPAGFSKRLAELMVEALGESG
ncbi:MAG: molecular chaperone HtpG [Deltaproteobacteria bacterium]|nr:molecular chaperone HtpG [Deltaproteobacteria bacterium]MBW2417931.1 molecular chaperone HtpG [Deltaproteobacteria bacterium]